MTINMRITEAMSILNEFLKKKKRKKKCRNCKCNNPKITKPTFAWFHLIMPRSRLDDVWNEVQQRHEVPQNFKRVLSSRLRRLVLQDKLEKVKCKLMKKANDSEVTDEAKDRGEVARSKETEEEKSEREPVGYVANHRRHRRVVATAQPIATPSRSHHLQSPPGGGINRMKQHLARRKGDIIVCPKVPPDVRYQMEESLKGIVDKKKEYRERFTIENPYGGPISEGDDTHDYEEIKEIHRQAWERGKTTPSSLGKENAPVGQNKKGKFGDYFAPRTTPGAQPTIKSALSGKEANSKAHMEIAKFFYDTCIPINACNSRYFQSMFDAALAIGPGYNVPSYHDLRLPLLRDAKKELQLWIDNIRSPSNVVHMVTDNGSNNVAAGRLIQDHFTHINWSPCAAHCLNLVLKDIAKMDHVAAMVNQASKLTSIDKLDVWIVDDEEEPFLNHEDIEVMLYEQLDPPRMERQRHRPREDDNTNEDVDAVEVDDYINFLSFEHFNLDDNLHDISIRVGMSGSTSGGGVNEEHEEWLQRTFRD
ncbi:hypothetical protein BUALT_Bualt16G0060100 [Buddleja alternifolia]|uniref:DUF659 domain-containing protein n=1 Tax=Buddleja alternifolia TaxID=168488 RepID=A0AAV6WH85_9LAMI|nr:hypothetical protein BUALT_Bualt16G0060100 [Buddleja alternifolia]